MLSKGQVINGRYEIIKLIGEGGMANVYLAYDPILKRNVAVKILRGDLSNDEKFVKRFKKYLVHDENNQLNIGDTVSAIECRPLSKSKKFRLKAVLKTGVE